MPTGDQATVKRSGTPLKLDLKVKKEKQMIVELELVYRCYTKARDFEQNKATMP